MNMADQKTDTLAALAAGINLTGAEATDWLCKEIEEAKREWQNANRFFDYAVGQDQVDYAIYALISAEKRYEMLLRAAKQKNQKWPEWRRGFE